MASLRDNLFVNPGLTPQERLAAEAGGQTSLRRGYETGRIGTEANYLAAEEASLRASGRTAEADDLRSQIGALQARQAAFAPEVSDLRQINGIGDLGSYVAGQVGQGVASMQDPALLATGVAAATRLGPVARAVGRAAPVLPGAAAFGLNQRQMTGEFYNNAVQDPTIMATHSAQDLNRVANAYGALGGAVDTMLPAAAARRVAGGKGLMPTTMRQAGMPLGARVGLDMAGEGATEGLQQFGQQQTLGMLNPNRDTSEDGWELANAVAGGALGGGPISAVSQLADQARAPRQGTPVNGKPGDEFDLNTGEGGSPNAPKGGRLRKVLDLFGEREVDLGKPDAPKAPAAAPTLSKEDRDILLSEPPTDVSDPEALETFMAQMDRQSEVAGRYLQGRQEPEAQALLQRLSPENEPADRRRAQSEATEYVTKRLGEDDLIRRAEQGSTGERAVRTATELTTRGVTAAAKAALKASRAAMQGVKDAATKKNLQTTDDKVQRIGDNLGAFLRGESRTVPLSQRSAKLEQHFQRLGEDLGDLIETSELNRSQGGKGKGAAKGRTGLPPRLMRQAISMADDLLTAFGREGAEQRVTEMQRIAGEQGGRAVFDTLSSLIENGARNLATAKARSERELGLSLIKHMDPVQAQEAYGSADIRTALIKAVDAVSRGAVTPKQREVVGNSVGGAWVLDAMLREYNGTLTEADPDTPGAEGTVDDRAESADNTDAPAPKGTKEPTRVYGFHKTSKLRMGRAFDSETGKDGERARPRLFTADTEVTVDTPTGKAKTNALQKKIEDVTKGLGKQAAKYKVDKKSALDAMRDEGLSDEQMLLAYRDYLRMDAKDGEKTLPESVRRTMLKDARSAATLFLDRTEGPTTVNADGRKLYRMEPMDALLVDERMREYFANRFIVTAEGVTDAEVEVMDVKAFMQMTDKARKVVDYSRKFANDGKGNAGVVLDERNVIFFEQKGESVPVLADDLVKWARKQRKASEAADLVSNDDASDLASSARNKQFIQDLSMGMAAVLDSGLVNSKLPWKVNAEGEQEKFGDRFRPQKVGGGAIPSSQLPPSLRLATTTVSGVEFEKVEEAMSAERAEQAAEDEESRQEAVAIDQDREEGFVVDPLKSEAVEPEVEPQDYAAMTSQERAEYNALTTPAQRREYLSDRGLDRKSGERFSSAPNFITSDRQPRRADADKTVFEQKGGFFDNPTPRDKPAKDMAFGGQRTRAVFTDPAKTRRDDRTPLDFFGEDRRDKDLQSIPDEFSQQRIQSRSEGFDAAQAARPPVTPMQAKRFVDRDAQEIVKALTPLPEGKTVVQAPGALGRPEEGLAMIESRLKSAARPKGGTEGLTGGIHYIYPVVRVLNADQLGTYDMALPEIGRLMDLREQAARVLMKADISPAERVRLTRELTSAQRAPTVGPGNVMQTLARIAGEKPADGGVEPVSVKPQPAAPATDRAYEREVMDRMLKENYEGLDTKADMDKFLKTAHAMWQRGKAREAEMNRLAESQDDAEQARAEKALQLLRALDGTFKEGGYAQADLGSFYEDIADVTDADVRAMLAGSEVPAQAPKSSAAPAGARNAQAGDTGDNSQEAQLRAIKHIEKVLPGVKVAFEDITGYSGEWIEAKNLIVVARQSAPGALQTAYHEAMHAFFSKFLKNNPEAQRVMRSLAENPKVMERVVALLAKYPAARQQLVDGEERLAYIYQFWAAGLLPLPNGRPQTIMQKVRKFLRRAAGMITDTERAVEILEAFHSGDLAKPSYAGRVIADVIKQGTMTPKARRKFDKQLQAVYATIAPAETVLATSASPTARKVAKQFFTNPGDEDSAGGEPGYLNARRVVASQYSNRFARIVEGMTEADMNEVTRLLQQKAKPEDIAYVPHRRAVERIRDLLGNFYDYMTDGRSLPVADAGRDYFPTVWDFDALVEKKKEFIDLINNKYQRDGEELWGYLVGATSKEGKREPTRTDGVLNPFFAGKEKVELPWIEAADREQFLQKGLVETMTTYFHRGARAAEYHHRFGKDGERLAKDLKRVEKELQEAANAQLADGKFDDRQQADAWAQRQLKQVLNATAAMEGSLGKDTDEKWRKVTSYVTAYQNIRLLPLTLFASFVDPLNMVSRGATMKEAYETFLRGMSEVFRNWRNMMSSEPQPAKMDRWAKLAEDIGAVDNLMFSEFVSEQYSSGYMAPGAKKANDWLFRVNGMEAWNRGMRSGAVRSAVKFIERNVKEPSTHSARWLKELGLEAADVQFDADGELVTSSVKVRNAINRWVEGAVLTPNAAQRPSWASDPRWSFMFHLKQFSYSFHQTILKRAVKEMNHGNMAPLGSFLWYVPTMIASDVIKGLIQGGGELPNSMQGMNMGDWVMRGVERAGFLGIPGIAFDSAGDLSSLAGPAVDQVVDAITDPAGKTALSAMPLMPLYRNLVN